MAHNLRPLALILLALVTLGITGVPSGSAESTSAHFTAQTYPATIHGATSPEVTFFGTEASSVVCGSNTFHGELSEQSQTLFLKPTTVNCRLSGYFSVTVNIEGCGYLYHITTRASADEYQAHIDLTCPEGQSIKIAAGNCKFEIPPQSGLTTVDFANMTASPESMNDVTMRDTVAGVSYVVTQDPLGCPFSGVGKRTGGTFSASSPTTLQGFIPGGAQQGFDIG